MDVGRKGGRKVGLEGEKKNIQKKWGEVRGGYGGRREKGA